jgi:folate-binding protein YgfZ
MSVARWFASPEDWSLLRVRGEDSAKFLQSFCTNDVQRLSVSETCEALFTDVKARVIAYAWVVRRDNGFDVLLGSHRAPELAAHLDRYLIRERVTLEPTEAPLAVVVACGECDALAGLASAAIAGLGPDCVAFYGEPTDTGVLAATLGAKGFARLDAAAWHAERVRARQPLDHVDVDTRNLPQELDRDARAISFTKGCYLGQEPVARIDALGQVNWRMRVVQLASEVASGAELTRAGKTVARVTSCAAIEEGALALAYVRREHAASGTALDAATVL